MKTLFYYCTAVILLSGCASKLPENHFQLNGSIQGIEDQHIYLTYNLNDTTSITDSTRINNGNFRFTGTLKQPVQLVTLYIGVPTDFQHMKYRSFYLEPKEMTITINPDKFSEAKITGSQTQAEVDSLETKTKLIMEEAKPIRDAITAEKDKEKRAILQEKMESYYERIKKLQIAFIKTHPNSYATLDYMRFLMGNMTYEEIKDIYDNLSSDVKKHGNIKEIEDELAALSKIQPGQPAPDFATLNIQGDSIRFSEVVKGKYVLLDFWASWCVPCRKSFPYVKELYKKYHDKGLEVFCVADNDGQPDAWRKAVKDDGIEMFHHVLRGMKTDQETFNIDKTNDISNKYAIHLLPTKFLIDRDFRIIGKFNDEELDDKLKEIFK